jgi:linoleoyl-CoA desaturase
MTQQQVIRFSTHQKEFFPTLQKRVNEYFKSRNISRHGNMEMYVKTTVMFSLYLIPYTLIMTGIVAQPWAMFGLCVVMGIGISGIGLSVMHDANHGAYSRHAWLNDLMGYSLNLVGATSFNWKVQHNVLHHTYTNIHDVDEDISPRGILRMCPYSEWKSFHKFQHLYAWFVYGLMTIAWVTVKDFARLIKYKEMGLIQKQKTTPTQQWTVLIVTKLIYYGYAVALPIMILPVAWWQILIGFFTMHYIAGFILAIIFQPAHVIDGTDYPMPDSEGNLENSWAVHQLITTSNYAPKNRFLSWFVGGLNYQVEHHLFPNICHVHYRDLSKIVRSTAEEFGIPYRSEETFMDAVVGHGKLLKELGKKPVNNLVHA